MNYEIREAPLYVKLQRGKTYMKMTHVYTMQMQWGDNSVGPTCKHGCHINGLITSSIDQDDEHINVVADDTGIFAFLWL